MGRRRNQQQVQYVTATPQRTPEQIAQDEAFSQQSQSQLTNLQQAYEKQLAGLQAQFGQNQGSSQSIIDALTASLKSQEQAAAESRRLTDEARRASEEQLRLIAAQRDGSAAQMGDQLAVQTTQSTSMLNRLQRRQRARQTRY